MLLRGQNLLGYRHYEDTVVERFVDKAAENGMDVFRVFDALNDIRNLQHSDRAPCGRRASTRRARSATPSARCTPSPPSSRWPKQLLEMGCDSICIKDMAALLKPQPAYDIVKGIKEACGEETLVHVHVPRHHRRHAGQPDEGHRGRVPTSWIRRSVACASVPATIRPRAWWRCSKAPASRPSST